MATPSPDENGCQLRGEEACSEGRERSPLQERGEDLEALTDLTRFRIANADRNSSRLKARRDEDGDVGYGALH
jgi:hypothetical protein